MSIFDFSKILPFSGCKEIHPNAPIPANLVGFPESPRIKAEYYHGGRLVVKNEKK